MARRLPPPNECTWLEAIELADTLEQVANQLLDAAGQYPAARGFITRAKWRGQLRSINQVRSWSMGYRRRAMELRSAETW